MEAGDIARHGSRCNSSRPTPPDGCGVVWPSGKVGPRRGRPLAEWMPDAQGSQRRATSSHPFCQGGQIPCSQRRCDTPAACLPTSRAIDDRSTTTESRDIQIHSIRRRRHDFNTAKMWIINWCMFLALPVRPFATFVERWPPRDAAG